MPIKCTYCKFFYLILEQAKASYSKLSLPYYTHVNWRWGRQEVIDLRSQSWEEVAVWLTTACLMEVRDESASWRALPTLWLLPNKKEGDLMLHSLSLSKSQISVRTEARTGLSRHLIRFCWYLIEMRSASFPLSIKGVISEICTIWWCVMAVQMKMSVWRFGLAETYRQTVV